jgi:Chitobiase/beta-hexosaminidase C-terminal domain/PA14 domain
LQPTVSISAPAEGAAVYYTTDGTAPTQQSVLYSKPFTVNATTIVKAIAIKEGLINSDVLETTVKAYATMKPVATGKLSAGLQYKYYETDAMSISKTEQLQPVKSGIVNDFNTDNKNRKEKYGFVFEGFVKISKTGMYDFYTISDDGSMLYIDDQLIVNNDGNHGMEERSDKAFLAKGMHKIKVAYYDAGGDNGLNVNYNLQGENKVKIPAGILFH